jgi:hypothetical protein
VELLQAAGAARAKLLVVAIDDRRKAVRMVEGARNAFPELKILARAIDRPHAYDLMRAGAHFIARETFNTAVSLGREALVNLGQAPERASFLADVFEKHDTEGLYKLFQYWGDEADYGFRIRKNLEALQRVLQDDEDTRKLNDAEETPRPAPESG